MAWPAPKHVEGEILGMGGSCFVTYVDEHTVRKCYEIWDHGKRRVRYPFQCEANITREAQMYHQMGSHPAILRFLGCEEIAPHVHALLLERAPLGSVRDYIQTNGHPGPGPESVMTFGTASDGVLDAVPDLVPDLDPDPLTEPALDWGTRLRMCLDVAEGLAHAHARRVCHCDLSCRNLLLFDDLHVKIADWAGSLIQGHKDPTLAKNTTYEEMQYELPCRGRRFVDRPVIKRELFALGSTIYEIMAWARPFQGVPHEEIVMRYAHDEFPSLDGLPAPVARIIEGCWQERYDSADEIVKALRKYLLSDSRRKKETGVSHNPARL